MAFNTRIQTRRDTAANWEAKNPVLLAGELIIVTTNAGDIRFKIGDGTKTYTQLPFQDESLYNALSGKAGTSDLEALQTEVDGKADEGHTHDLATTTTPGFVMVDGTAGIGVNTENGNLFIKQASNSEIDDKQHSYKPITPENLDYAVKAALVNNANTLSASEKESVLSWIDASPVDHAHSLGTNPTGGVANDTVSFWKALGYGVAWISENDQVNSQPSQYGFIINYVSDNDVFQIFRDQESAITYFRSGDDVNDWFRSWREVIVADGDGYLRVPGLIAPEYVTASDGESHMTLYPTGLGSDNNNFWVNNDGGAWFTEAYVGTKDNYKELVTQEYVDNAVDAITPANIGAAASSHNQAASTITAGTFAGQVVANSSGETYSTYCLRNTRLASSDTTPTVNGEICWTYG